MPLDPAYAGKTYPPAPPYLVGREKIREFAVAIGADDPVYLDPEAARAAGHPDVIAPPTFAIVLCQWGIETLIGDPGLGLDFDRVVHGEQRFRYVRPLHAGVRVTRPVVVPDTDEGTELVVTGVVKSTTEEGARVLDLTATCQGEKVLAQARATVRA